MQRFEVERTEFSLLIPLQDVKKDQMDSNTAKNKVMTRWYFSGQSDTPNGSKKCVDVSPSELENLIKIIDNVQQEVDRLLSIK